MREVDSSKLEQKGDVFYVLNEKQPFTGVINTYYEDGQQIACKANFKDGKLHGEYIQYYEDGQIEIKSNYYGGKKDGESILYNQKGQVVVGGSYKEGKIVAESNK